MHKFLKPISVLLGTASLALASPAFAEVANQAPKVDEATQQYRDRLEHASSESVLAMLRAGNHRFVQGRSTQGKQANNQQERRRISLESQRGVAVVLSCIDSRVAPELVFDTAVGDIYTVRVGANVVNDDVLGSIEVAVASGARAVVVMGHTRCAEVRAACSNMELEHFTDVIAKAKPAIALAQSKIDSDQLLAKRLGTITPANNDYIAVVSEFNARYQAEQMLKRSVTIREAVRKGETQVIPALYHVETGVVSYYPAIEPGFSIRSRDDRAGF